MLFMASCAACRCSTTTPRVCEARKVSEAGPLSERAIILAPNGRDAQIAASILREAGLLADICTDLVKLREEIEAGAGMAVIADEAIRHADLRPLANLLARQAA